MVTSWIMLLGGSVFDLRLNGREFETQAASAAG